MNPLVILGSARPDGETRRAIDLAFAPKAIDLVVLPDFAIGGYDYQHINAQDDFAAIAHRMAETDHVIFATPVYWYAMSAPLKIFFDRLTDMTENLKGLGKSLAGRRVWVIATGVESALPEGFEVPFARTADYFGMRYRGAAYLFTGDDSDARAASEIALRRFGENILAG
jgi:putative NADPH-quinone reductase